MNEDELLDDLYEENESRLDEDMSSFPNSTTFGDSRPLSGKFAAFFKSWFGSKEHKQKRGRPPKQQPLAGDVIKNADVFTQANGQIGISKGMPRLPQVEQERRRKYQDYERMDEYPEIGAALDIYADDATQEDLRGTTLKIDTEQEVIKEVLEAFGETIKIERFLWDVTRNVVKYGDCFLENIVDLNNPEAGIQRLKILNPNYLFRVEDKYGYLREFMQEVPKAQESQPQYAPGADNKHLIKLDKDQIVHFRNFNSAPHFYPYGKSILAPGVRAWKSLRLMEDAMLIYRLVRAPERRIFYVETGNLPATKVEMFMERLKAKFKKEKFYNQNEGGIDERYNPLAADEDFFVPQKNGQGTKIETLQGGQNLGEVDDVKYFRDKVLAAMKVPKDFIVEKDSSPERKANLSQLDAKFAKAVMRIQRDIEIGLTTLYRRHLQLKGFPPSMVTDFKLKLAPPSDITEKRRLEIDEQKTRVVQAVQGLGLFPKEYLYRTYFQLTEGEIKEITDAMDEEQEEQQMGEAGQPPEMGPDGQPLPGGGEGGPDMGGGPGGLGGGAPPPQ